VLSERPHRPGEHELDGARPRVPHLDHRAAGIVVVDHASRLVPWDFDSDEGSGSGTPSGGRRPPEAEPGDVPGRGGPANPTACPAAHACLARMAMSAASTRLRAPVVLNIDETCTLTVPGARCSAAAISAFVSPRLTRIRISCSRGVRRSKSLT